MLIFACILVLTPHGASLCPSSKEISMVCMYAEACSSMSAQLWSCSFLVDTMILCALLLDVKLFCGCWHADPRSMMMGSMCIGVGGMGKGSMTACAESRGCGIIGKGAFFVTTSLLHSTHHFHSHTFKGLSNPLLPLTLFSPLSLQGFCWANWRFQGSQEDFFQGSCQMWWS